MRATRKRLGYTAIVVQSKPLSIGNYKYQLLNIQTLVTFSPFFFDNDRPTSTRVAVTVTLRSDATSVRTMALLSLLTFSLVFQPSIGWSSPLGQRRLVLQSIVATSSATLSAAWLSPCLALAETIGKDPNCNSSNCLGVWDGLLADCPHARGPAIGVGCASSQDDTPGSFAEP